MRFLVLGLLLGLAACGTTTGGGAGPGGIFGNGPSAPLPTSGPVAYTCENGTQLMVDTHGGTSAQVAIVGGPSMVLPSAGTADAPYFSNGRYGFRGGGANAQWEVGRSAPVACRGG